MLTTVMACGSSSRGTASTTVEFHDGDCKAVQQPVTKTSQSTSAGPAQPAQASKASSTEAPVCTCTERSMRRALSAVSPSTPAGRASRNMGRNTAVCTSAARKEDPVSSTISHAAVVVCIAPAMK